MKTFASKWADQLWELLTGEQTTFSADSLIDTSSELRFSKGTDAGSHPPDSGVVLPFVRREGNR
jgi:hypothetical protein